MSNNEKRIMLRHLREQRGHYERGHYELHCTKRWVEAHGLSWEHFRRNGYTLEEVRAACPVEDVDAEKLITFIEENGLWDDDQSSGTS